MYFSDQNHHKSVQIRVFRFELLTFRVGTAAGVLQFTRNGKPLADPQDSLATTERKLIDLILERFLMDGEQELEAQRTGRKCYGCSELLPRGISFCVTCGKHNLSPDAPMVAVAKTDMATHKSRELWKRIQYWFRTHGLRR